jgi:hypothetical protein
VHDFSLLNTRLDHIFGTGEKYCASETCESLCYESNLAKNVPTGQTSFQGELLPYKLN